MFQLYDCRQGRELVVTLVGTAFGLPFPVALRLIVASHRGSEREVFLAFFFCWFVTGQFERVIPARRDENFFLLFHPPGRTEIARRPRSQQQTGYSNSVECLSASAIRRPHSNA